MDIQDVRAKFENTEDWLKAPNGNPTNLTEQQWLMTRTTAFKKWFGDWEDSYNHSQVIDENGESQLMPCFLNIRSIKTCKDHGNLDHWKIQITAAARKGITGIIYLNRYEGISYEEFEAARKNHGLTDDKLDALSDANFQKYVSKSAFSYIVFESNQIKSAINNSEFSRKSDDIYA